ncbi:hypothetical protein [Acinetobacter baylyi]|uniref:hypothetical protein n=1 Tax=Acinetobacter baylyi TaxID=202950 RepID=UPI000EA36F18|nr:hypothetical protein [Acinetobacter baylyi]
MKLDEIYDNGLKNIAQNLPKEFILWFEEFEDIEPWKTFYNNKSELIRFNSLLRKKFPEGNLLPFSYIHDITGFCNDSWPIVASFDLKSMPQIRIYDFAQPKNSPWDNYSYKNFDHWLEMARHESTAYKLEINEIDGLNE